MDDSENNINFDKIYFSYQKEFNLREEERSKIKQHIQSIIKSISDAEQNLVNMRVFGANEQYHLVKAKAELIDVLRNIENSANIISENNLRVLKQFVENKIDEEA